MLALTTCMPMPVADDEGHATFAREAIKSLLARPAWSVDEVKFVADTAALLGRDVAANMLMKDTAFVDTWTEVLVDLLQVQREGGNQLAGQDKDCWGAPTRANPDPAIARWVRDHGPRDSSPQQSWNMTDLLRSAIAIDDLSPVYRAYLFPLSMRRAIITPGSWEEGARRQEITRRLFRIYLNRDTTCLGCHNRTRSASDKVDTNNNIVWRRLWAIPGDAEAALLGPPYAAVANLMPILRSDVRQDNRSSNPPGILPWGMGMSCARDSVDDRPDNTGWGSGYTNIGFLATPPPNTETGSFGSVIKDPNHPDASLWELETALRNGIDILKTGYSRRNIFMATDPFFQVAVDPDPAFAYQTATNLVDGIFMAAMGHRLTIAHGFSRIKEQRDMLWELTEDVFLPNNWSLKAVLTKILASDWYARRAPAISQSDTSYKLPPILDPWIIADPTDVTNPNPAPHEKYNGQGEEVDRFRVSALLRQIAGALGWKPPSRFPDTSQTPAYPSALAQNLGQYISPQNPGFTGVNFQSLLALEAETGACDKTNRAVVNSRDWIDALVAGIAGFNADPANAGAEITVGEAWTMLKDRLIQDPSINNVGAQNNTKSEQQALVDFLRAVFGDPNLTLNASTATAAIAAKLEMALRNACGILVKSPQFVLTNITPRTYTGTNMPDPPRLSVCLNSSEACGYAQICTRWSYVLGAMGHPITCLNRSVAKTPTGNVPWVDPDILNQATGRIAASAPSGQDWLVLTRQSQNPRAQPILPAAAKPLPPARQVTPPPTARSNAASMTDVPAPPLTPAGRPQFDLIQSVAINPRAPLRGLDRIRQRLATLCPGGLCGSKPRGASSIARCIENPGGNSCLALFPACDPRSQRGPNSCGALPADFTDSGVLAVWAAGAEVKEATNARVLRSGDQRWQPLQAGVKLDIGDMIYLPLAGSLRLQYDSVAFGDTRMTEAQVAGLAGHLLAITGPSAEKLLERAPAPGAMSPAELIRGVQSGIFETRAVTAAEWERAAATIARREISPPLTPVQMGDMNSNYEALHRGFLREKPK